MTKDFTESDLLKFSEKEKEVLRQMNGSTGRGDMARAAQFRADTVAAMWARVLYRLAAKGAPK